MSRRSEDFYLAPLQPLCVPCHDSVKRKLEHAYRRGEMNADPLRMDSQEAIRLLGPTLGVDPETGLPLDPRHPWYRKPK